MKQFPLLFAGIFATFALGWLGTVAMPMAQLGSLQPQTDEELADIYPVNIGGVAEQGRQVYVANGCVYCHSQVVRDKHSGADLDRGWGTRRTVARDYIYNQTVQLGTMRNGPDLTNIGVRQLSAEWHYQHLYNPRSVSPGSIMPPFRFLFEKRKIVGQRSAEALNLSGADQPPQGWEIVPTAEAKSLVGFLRSLDSTHALKEVKEMQEAAAK